MEHPWERAVKEAKKKGVPLEPEEVRKFLESHGYYTGNRLVTLKKPYILAVNPEIDRVLGIGIREGTPRTFPREGLEPQEKKLLYYLPEADARFDASVIAYKIAKEHFGDRLKAFAVTGGSLTENIVGVPVKVKNGDAHAGIVDDLDILLLVEGGAKDEEVRRYLEKVEKEIDKRGLPKVVIDYSRPFIFSPDQLKELTYFLHKKKPLAVYEGRELIKEIRKKIYENPELRKAAEREEKNYEKKIRMYRAAIEEILKQSFRNALKMRIRRKKMWNVANHFEELYHIIDSPNVRELLDNLIMEHAGKYPNLKLRYAATLLLLKYLDFAKRTYLFSHPDIVKFLRGKKHP